MQRPGPRTSPLTLEQLEDRTLLSTTPATSAVVPNDPQFSTQYALQNTGQNGGTPGADIHAAEAWSVTTGSRAVSVAVTDTGIDYNHPDLYQNIWLNDAEIPASRMKNLTDVDGDGIITFADLQNPINQGVGKVQDLNHDGRIDAGDILQPMTLNAQGQDTGLGGWAYAGNTQDGDTAHPNDFIGWNFVNNTNDPMDDNGHGTNVAGVIGAMGNNGVGVTGINWQTSLMAIKALDVHGSGTAANLIAAVQYATKHGAKIINASWAVDGNWPNLQKAIGAAQQAGEIFVDAAGNGATNLDNTPSYPSSFKLPNMVSVAATDDNDNLASFSNYGPNTVALGAPGVSIVSTYPGKSYNMNTGTSMATPEVSGVLALVWGEHLDWNYQQVINQVLSTADKLPSLAGKTITGGRLDAAAAVGWNAGSSGQPTPTPPPVSGPPSITKSALLGASNTISTIQVTFNKPVQAGSFSPADVFFYNPGGQQITAQSVTVVAGSNDTVFNIVVPTQTANGVYSLTIGPEVFDASWDKMVVYKTTFLIGPPPAASPPPAPDVAPRINNSALLGASNTISTIQVSFSKPVQADSFSPADVFFYNPGGQQIAAQSVTAVAGTNNTVFNIVVPTQTAPGVYSLKIGPEVFDSAWTKMVVYQTTITIHPTYTVSSLTKLAVPAQSSGTSAVIFGQNVTILSVKVTVGVTFSSDGSLILKLIAPDGTTVVLSNLRGGSGANFQGTTFDDTASTPIAIGSAPFGGSYRPDSQLATLAGKNASGVWKLVAVDQSSSLSGTIDNWSLSIVSV
jgi:subtilisin family serine protease/subtilisin-like proprotein convertase family protein